MGQIIRVNLDSRGGVRGFVYEGYVSELFVRGLSLKRYLERVQHTDPVVAVTEILPLRTQERQGEDEAA